MILGIPHILLLLLISYALGKGLKGVVLELHLPTGHHLARVIRGRGAAAEEQSVYPDCPSAGTQQNEDSHEAYGAASSASVYRRADPDVSACDPARGQYYILRLWSFIRAAGDRHYSFGKHEISDYPGKWWLAVLPGVMLVLTVVLFDVVGSSLRKLLDPSSAHE